jgi:hypothetical protein
MNTIRLRLGPESQQPDSGKTGFYDLGIWRPRSVIRLGNARKKRQRTELLVNVRPRNKFVSIRVDSVAPCEVMKRMGHLILHTHAVITNGTPCLFPRWVTSSCFARWCSRFEEHPCSVSDLKTAKPWFLPGLCTCLRMLALSAPPAESATVPSSKPTAVTSPKSPMVASSV